MNQGLLSPLSFKVIYILIGYILKKKNNELQGCDFFASKIELGKEGVVKVHGLGEIADWEKDLLDACLKDLAANIKKVNLFSNVADILQGKDFVAANP